MEKQPAIEMLSAQECRAYLAQARIGRVAVSVGALPAIHTVSFALTGGCVVFRVAQGSPLRRAVAESVVAFSADGFDETDEDGWSVLAQGVGEEVIDPALTASLRSLPLRSHSEEPESDCFVRVPLTQVNGTRVHWPLLGGDDTKIADLGQLMAEGTVAS
jgi:uncharacterized protein